MTHAHHINVAVRRLPHGEGLDLPPYATPGAAGLDLLAAVAAQVQVLPGHRKLIPTGIAIALPDGYEAQVRSRSGMAARDGVVVLNSPGTIDSDFRGEVMVLLINQGHLPFTVTRGMRIAQLVVAPVARIGWTECARLTDTERGEGGFGSTGVHHHQEHGEGKR